MATPVSVLRLPKGPDPNSRGFDPKSPRFIALCRTSIPTSAAAEADAEQLPREQHARSVLRESFLRCLLSMTNKKVQFHMYEKVMVEGTFGASDIDVLNFQVSDLHTPIGVQKEALIRCRDVISFTFDVWTPEAFCVCFQACLYNSALCDCIQQSSTDKQYPFFSTRGSHMPVFQERWQSLRVALGLDDRESSIRWFFTKISVKWSYFADDY